MGSPLEAASFGIPADAVGTPADYPGAETDLSRFRVGDLVRTPSRSYLLGTDGPHPAQRVRRGRLRRGGLRRPGPRRGPPGRPRRRHLPRRVARRHARRRPRAGPVCGAPPRRRGPGCRRSSSPAPRRRPPRPPRSGRRATRSTSRPRGAPTSAPAPTTRRPTGRRTSSTPRPRSTPSSAPTSPLYIGYGDSAAPVVPNTWLEFFDRGRAALGQRRPPGPRGRAGDRGRRRVMTAAPEDRPLGPRRAGRARSPWRRCASVPPPPRRTPPRATPAT